MFIVPLGNLPPIQSIDGANQQQGEANIQTGDGSFANMMQQAIDTLEQAQEAAAADSYNLAMGDVSSLHSLMINSAMETTAIQMVTQITSRAVSSYKEIMQMQI